MDQLTLELLLHVIPPTMVTFGNNNLRVYLTMASLSSYNAHINEIYTTADSEIQRIQKLFYIIPALRIIGIIPANNGIYCGFTKIDKLSSKKIRSHFYLLTLIAIQKKRHPALLINRTTRRFG